MSGVGLDPTRAVYACGLDLGHMRRFSVDAVERWFVMGFDDKVENKSEQLGGKVKEGLGKLTDDKELQAEGKADQASGKLGDLAESAKDKAEQLGEDIKAGFEKVKDKFSN